MQLDTPRYLGPIIAGSIAQTIGTSEAEILRNEADALNERIWIAYIRTEAFSPREDRLVCIKARSAMRLRRRQLKKIRTHVMNTITNEETRIRVLAAAQLRKADPTITYYQSIALMRKMTLKQCVMLARTSPSVS